MKKIIFLLIVTLGLTAILFAKDYNEFIKVKSNYTYYRTVKEIQNNLNIAGYEIIRTIDLKERANTLKAKVPPSTLILFTKKNLESKLIKINKLTALELPFKILVTKNKNGMTTVIYKNFNYLQNFNIPQPAIDNLNRKIRVLVFKSTNRKPVIRKLKKVNQKKKLKKLEKN